MSEVVKLDPADVAGGRVEFASFPSKLASLDVEAYRGKHVQLEGCAPTWAHLLVAGKLFNVAAAVDFVVDDGKSGKAVEVFRKG
ncbi:MAG: hypothetical protein JO102_02595 [Elusimicrobia bacterium]|nr:hypothetical protein [Elusimicrobiota bacterium]